MEKSGQAFSLNLSTQDFLFGLSMQTWMIKMSPSQISAFACQLNLFDNDWSKYLELLHEKENVHTKIGAFYKQNV